MTYKLYEGINGKEKVEGNERGLRSRSATVNGTGGSLEDCLRFETSSSPFMLRRFMDKVSNMFSYGNRHNKSSELENISQNVVNRLNNEGYTVSSEIQDGKSQILVGDKSNGYNLVNRIENVEEPNDVPNGNKRRSPVMTSEAKKTPLEKYGMEISLEEVTSFGNDEISAKIGPVDRQKATDSEYFEDYVAKMTNIQFSDY